MGNLTWVYETRPDAVAKVRTKRTQQLEKDLAAQIKKRITAEIEELIRAMSMKEARDFGRRIVEDENLLRRFYSDAIVPRMAEIRAELMEHERDPRKPLGDPNRLTKFAVRQRVERDCHDLGILVEGRDGSSKVVGKTLVTKGQARRRADMTSIVKQPYWDGQRYHEGIDLADFGNGVSPLRHD